MSLLKQIYTQTKVHEFLDSLARNSYSSKEIYAVGLSHFQRFLNDKFPNQNKTLETIIEPLTTNEINVYTLLDNFVSYILKANQLSPNSISLYLAAVKSYLGYYDIDIVSSKFKRKVRLPKNHREDEEPIDASDIRKILLSCNNRRLKPYLLFLASGGMRTIEALATRIRDIDFSVSPTKVHIRKEYAKTRVSRDVYISNECTKYLLEWLDWKYRKRKTKELTPVRSGDDLVFSKAKFGFGNEENGNEKTQQQANPEMIYIKITKEFNSILKTVKMDERKERMLRRKITLHSLRRYVKTVISNVVSQDYSEWFLGHAKSRYWTMKEPQRREIYATKCMKYLTFLDYSGLEATGKNVEAKLEQKDREIAYLRERDTVKEDIMAGLSDKILDLTLKVDRLMKDMKRYST
jgi:integrase